MRHQKRQRDKNCCQRESSSGRQPHVAPFMGTPGSAAE
jgi:hypothetical protein